MRSLLDARSFYKSIKKFIILNICYWT